MAEKKKRQKRTAARKAKPKKRKAAAKARPKAKKRAVKGKSKPQTIYAVHPKAVAAETPGAPTQASSS